MERKKVVIDMETDESKVEKLKRKAKLIGRISYESTMRTLEDPHVYTLAASIGLYQGLKYRGSVKQGFKGGLAAMGVSVGVNVIQGIIKNRDAIERA